jgi:hypothetical protein
MGGGILIFRRFNFCDCESEINEYRSSVSKISNSNMSISNLYKDAISLPYVEFCIRGKKTPFHFISIKLLNVLRPSIKHRMNWMNHTIHCTFMGGRGLTFVFNIYHYSVQLIIDGHQLQRTINTDTCNNHVNENDGRH